MSAFSPTLDGDSKPPTFSRRPGRLRQCRDTVPNVFHRCEGDRRDWDRSLYGWMLPGCDRPHAQEKGRPPADDYRGVPVDQKCGGVGGCSKGQRFEGCDYEPAIGRIIVLVG